MGYFIAGQRVVVSYSVHQADKGSRATLLSNRSARGFHRADVDGGRIVRLHACELRPLTERDL